jgi:hypothetical protein
MAPSAFGDGICVYAATSEGGYVICKVGNVNGDPEAEANARLIVSAHDLLEALHDGIDALARVDIEPADRSRVLGYMRAAIAKARGEAA